MKNLHFWKYKLWLSWHKSCILRAWGSFDIQILRWNFKLFINPSGRAVKYNMECCHLHCQWSGAPAWSVVTRVTIEQSCHHSQGHLTSSLVSAFKIQCCAKDSVNKTPYLTTGPQHLNSPSFLIRSVFSILSSAILLYHRQSWPSKLLRSHNSPLQIAKYLRNSASLSIPLLTRMGRSIPLRCRTKNSKRLVSWVLIILDEITHMCLQFS
jgi:hypothetical protein